MNKFFVPLLFLPALLLGQEDFSFPIYFEDSAGHKDTVYFGYDNLATDSLDTGFGEANISHVPWDTTLDVRLAGVWQGQSHWQGNYLSPFQTKKLIARPLCDGNAPVFTVEILTRHWPVTARWDSTLFQGSCLSTTTFSSIISDGIADSRRVVNGVKGNFLGFVKFSEESRITFTEQRYGRYLYFYEVTPDPVRIDTVNLFWVSLSRAAFDGHIISVFETGKRKPADFRIDPTGSVSFTLASPTRVTLTAFTASGQKVAVLLAEEFSAGAHTRRVDAAALPNGLYVYRLQVGDATESRTIVRTR